MGQSKDLLSEKSNETKEFCNFRLEASNPISKKEVDFTKIEIDVNVHSLFKILK